MTVTINDGFRTRWPQPKRARDNHREMAAYYSPGRLSVKKTALAGAVQKGGENPSFPSPNSGSISRSTPNTIR